MLSLAIMALIRYFAYGSNMSRQRLEARLDAVSHLGAVCLPQYRHQFNKIGDDGSGKGNIEPCAGARVHGVLYDLSTRQLDHLHHAYEIGYSRLEITVIAGTDQPVSAITFRADEISRTELVPTEDYLAHYQTGILENEIPTDYLARLLATVTKTPR